MPRFPFVLVCLAVAACGGAPPPTHDVTALPSASSAASAPPAVDLSPVARPSSVVVVIHAAHVGATSDMVAEWAGQPIDVDVQLADMVGERMAKVVDLDGSADMVFTAEDRGPRQEPDVRDAVGLPVKSFESAKATLTADYGLVPLPNGVFDVTRHGHRRDGDSDFRSCALAPTPGGGGRIVCSHDAVARDAVVPYLTRGLAAFDGQKSDLHVEARPGPFREIVRRERASITQSGARFMGGQMRGAWEAVVADLCDSFLDVGHATLDASIDKQAGTVDVRVVAKTTNGAVTRLLTGHPDHAGPPPATFMRLPADADVAFFGHGPDAAELAVPKAMILQALDAAAADDGNKMKDADRKALLDAFGHAVDLLAAPVIVYARGVDFGKAVPAVSGLTEQSDAGKIKAGIEQAAGWDVLGADIDPTSVTALAKEWSAVLSRAALATEMAGDHMSVRLQPVVRGAPPKTLEVALTKSHQDWDKKRPPVVLTLHVLVVPDQTRVWIVTALDQATAVARARGLVAGTSTLASRAGLDGLNSARLNMGGFVTSRAAGLGIPLTWLFTWNPRWKMANDPLMGISSQTQYTTPVLFTAAEAEAGGEHELSFGVRFPRPALQEVLQVGPRLFH